MNFENKYDLRQEHVDTIRNTISEKLQDAKTMQLPLESVKVM